MEWCQKGPWALSVQGLHLMCGRIFCLCCHCCMYTRWKSPYVYYCTVHAWYTLCAKWYDILGGIKAGLYVWDFTCCVTWRNKVWHTFLSGTYKCVSEFRKPKLFYTCTSHKNMSKPIMWAVSLLFMQVNEFILSTKWEVHSVFFSCNMKSTPVILVCDMNLTFCFLCTKECALFNICHC